MWQGKVVVVPVLGYALVGSRTSPWCSKVEEDLQSEEGSSQSSSRCCTKNKSMWRKKGGWQAEGDVKLWRFYFGGGNQHLEVLQTNAMGQDDQIWVFLLMNVLSNSLSLK
jgi:hypothetical protein